MNRSFYLDLARAGHRVPIGTDLVLHEQADAPDIMLSGPRLGQIVVDSARRYRSPLALPLMDLRIEKSLLAQSLGIGARPSKPGQSESSSAAPGSSDDIDQWHIDTVPDEKAFAAARKINVLTHPRAKATADAVAYVAQQKDLVPIGMGIGPFSLMTKLIADPITPVFLAGTGITAAEDEEVARVEKTFDLGMIVIEKFLTAQIDAGAKAIVICEPAANSVYFSPIQLANDTSIFDRYVMRYCHQIKSLLAGRHVDLIFHDCGELIPVMIEKFCSLDPAILSFGSSRKLWEDAAIVPHTTVLYGNLPSKRFYSDDLISVDDVRRMARELIEKVAATGHPFILGSECDVLSVKEHHATIAAKVQAMLDA
ncbi:MAG: uroporphyrinogen decarboxylase family protein [Phycisphaeraceae bacterium]